MILLGVFADSFVYPSSIKVYIFATKLVVHNTLTEPLAMVAPAPTADVAVDRTRVRAAPSAASAGACDCLV